MASTSTTAGQPDTEITSAFDGIAPTSASASASACSSKPPYDIFLNHRGPDVKHTLASDIYDALSAMGFKVFLDSEELDLGDFLPEAIHQAMHTASLHIGILSRRYAQSPWCLAELSFMLKTGTPIIPIFYHVQPDDARWVAKGKGIYVDAFSEHVKKGRYTTQKLDEWKTALHNVSYYTGEIINDNDDMKRVLKNIENRVRKAMKTVPFEAAKHLVCLNEAVKDFESIAPQSGQTQVVGIWGMGGSGKTTLAKELYNQKHSSMQASSFVFDVRDAAASKKLHKKQKKLLQDLGAKDLSFDNIEEGKVILSSRLRSVRVLVVLDDVDHGNQLDALLPTRDGLGRGSLIIVTTRDKEVLRSWDNSTIYKMRTLTHFHAQQLFCWHAFLRPYPLSGFEDLVMKFVDACDGLPLSLKVLGGQLYRESRKEIWQGLLQKISLLVEKDVKQCLKVSYEALDVQDQEAFLDTACFFNGVEKSLAIAVLDESGCGLICWERLVNKCLVEVEDDGLIRMHDHLRDLGREIAASQLPCRLWSPAQIMENQIRGQEKIEIRGMVSEIGRALAEQHDLSSDMKLMIKMDTRPEFCGVKRRRLLLNVKIFVVDGDYFNEQMAKVSRELVWLRWSEISHRSLPLWLPFKNLRVLELNGAKNLEELWEDGTDVPVLLRELVIDDCWEFRRFPSSIGFLKHLRKIVLLLNRMTNLPEEFCHLQSLEVLSLSGSIMLSSLPNNFGHLTNLRILNLSDSYELRTLPVTFKQLTLLQHLNLGGCEKLALESDILENMTNLQYLKLSGCRELKDLPLPITNQASLGELHLMDTRLRELPINIGQLSKLRQMQIGSPLLTSFPASIGNLSSLTSLQIHHCDNLESLPTSLENLSSLKSLDISLCIKLESLPHSVAHLIHLQTLKISYCPISKLEFGRGSFSSSLCNLNSIILSNTRVGTISIFEDRCPGIQNLKLLQNHHLTEVEELPTTVKHIEFINCEMLKKIRINGDLLNLETLIVVNCPELHMLPSFVGSTGLKCFEVRGCSKVEKIEGLQNCTSLEKLVADTCIEEVLGIRSLEYMDNLRTLNFKSNKRSIVQHCIQTIQKWPEEVVICSKAATEADAGSILNLSAFSNLFVVDSFANMKLSYPKLQQKHASNAGAIMLCYVLNCVSPHMIFGIDVRSGSRLPSESRIPLTVVDAGKWVYMCIFTQRSTFLKGKEFQIFQQFSGKPHPKFGDNEVEKGVLAIGDKKRVEEAFHQLLTLVKN